MLPNNQPTLTIVAFYPKRLGTPGLVRRSWRSRFDSLHSQILLRPSPYISYDPPCVLSPGYWVQVVKMTSHLHQYCGQGKRPHGWYEWRLARLPNLYTPLPASPLPKHPISEACRQQSLSRDYSVSVKRISTGLEGSNGKLHWRTNRNFWKDMRRRVDWYVTKCQVGMWMARKV